MARPTVVSTSGMVAAQLTDLGEFIDIPLPPHAKDDVLVLGCMHNPSPVIAQVPPAPPGWTASTGTTYNFTDRANSASGGAVVWWWRRADSAATPTPRITRPEATGATDSDCMTAGWAFVVRGCVRSGDPFQSRAVSSGSGVGDVPTLAVTSSQAGATAIVLVLYNHHSLSTPTSTPGGFVRKGERRAFVGSGQSAAVLEQPIDIGTILGESPTGITINDTANNFLVYGSFVFVALPAPDIGVGVQPATTVPIRGFAKDLGGEMSLGCATSYEAFITGPDYETRIDAVRWSDLSWDRVLDDISTATVALPDQFGGASCCAKFGGLVPWRFGLTIERNGQEIWKGPVTGLRRSGGALTVRASDVFARFKKRKAVQDESVRYVNNDAGQVFAELLNNHAQIPGEAWSCAVPQVTTGVPVTRNIVARDFGYAWEIAAELLSSAIDAFVLAGTPVVFQRGFGWIVVGAFDEQYILPGPYYASGELVYGLFTNEAFESTPEWDIDGYAQANFGTVVGADSGQSGFRKFWQAQDPSQILLDGVLDIVETTTLYRADDEEATIDETAYQRRVDSLVALRSIAPAVVEPLALSERAPVRIDHLRPGSVWLLDVHDACWGQLLQAQRVKRVSGQVSASNGGPVEKIGVTLQPLGFTEDDEL